MKTIQIRGRIIFRLHPSKQVPACPHLSTDLSSHMAWGGLDSFREPTPNQSPGVLRPCPWVPRWSTAPGFEENEARSSLYNSLANGDTVSPGLRRTSEARDPHLLLPIQLRNRFVTSAGMKYAL